MNILADYCVTVLISESGALSQAFHLGIWATFCTVSHGLCSSQGVRTQDSVIRAWHSEWLPLPDLTHLSDHCPWNCYLSHFSAKSEPLRKHGALHPQKTLRLVRDEEVGGSGIFISNTYLLRCHHQAYSALRWTAVGAILMFHSLCGQSHKTVSINHNFWRERRTKADWTEVLLLTSLAPYR